MSILKLNVEEIEKLNNSLREANKLLRDDLINKEDAIARLYKEINEQKIFSNWCLFVAIVEFIVAGLICIMAK